MADRVDTDIDPVQVPAREPASDRAPAQARGEELGARYDAVGRAIAAITPTGEGVDLLRFDIRTASITPPVSGRPVRRIYTRLRLKRYRSVTRVRTLTRLPDWTSEAVIVYLPFFIPRVDPSPRPTSLPGITRTAAMLPERLAGPLRR